jgi:pyruvate formate lyase activating enzyme
VLRAGEVDEIPMEQLFSYLDKRSGLLDGVCITGGEPLLNPDIEELIVKIRSYGLLVKLDTNGAFPERLETLLDKGLIDYVAMDVKNSDEKYGMTVGLGDSFDVSVIDRSIDIIMKKAPDYEFRTTVVRELHEREDLISIANKLKNAKRYFLQKYVDSGDVLASGYTAYEDADMLALHEAVREILPQAILRGV